MVELVALTRGHADALLDGADVFTARYGWTVVDGYLDFPEVLPRLRDGLPEDGAPAWGAQLFVDPEMAEVVGLGGFKGEPLDGSVEIGYSIAPTRRRRGHAREAATAMIARAEAARVQRVVAHTLAAPNPSNALLQGLGFRLCAEIDDPDDGPTWRWELPMG